MELKEKDFVLYKENNRIKSGGYSVKSILLNKNIPAATTFNKQEGGGKQEKVSDIYSDLAVPAGLFYMHQTPNLNTIRPTIMNDDNVLPDSIHDQLLELLQPSEKQMYNIKTRKHYKGRGKKKKTRRTI
jgi:hypothetical protein|tara:strand:- start:644 stop:1030 length:387 start_codon:yes stop_codon:yes gene_type:complete